MRRAVWSTSRILLGTAACFSFGAAGCGSDQPENPPSIGITNPAPDDPLVGVTLENEAQHLRQIQPGNGIKPVRH